MGGKRDGRKARQATVPGWVLALGALAAILAAAFVALHLSGNAGPMDHDIAAGPAELADHGGPPPGVRH